MLADWVTNSLREAILQNYFEPGEKLDQDSIAEEFQVSRTPVREAIRRLEAEGFVQIVPHRGAFISQVSPQDIHDVYEIRRLLESEIVRQVTPIIPQAILEELERSLEVSKIADEKGQRQKHTESDAFYHETIVNLAENQLLKEVLDSLTNRISLVRHFAQLQPGYHLTKSLEEHRAILQAMRDRDAGRAAELMAHHLDQSARRITEIVEKHQPAARLDS